MEPRLDGIKKGTIQVEQEVFGLDIAEYVDTTQKMNDISTHLSTIGPF